MAQVLSSWKEIAQYLGKGVRTVQRWEQIAGLPVKRPARGVHNIVVAYTDEIDRWLTRGGEEGELARLREENALLKARIAELERVHLERDLRSPVNSRDLGWIVLQQRCETLQVRTAELNRSLSESFRIAEELRSQRNKWLNSRATQANAATIFRFL